MITLTSDAPKRFYADQPYGQCIFIKAADGTYEYHYGWEQTAELQYIDVHPDPAKHLLVPNGGGHTQFVYIQGRKL